MAVCNDNNIFRCTERAHFACLKNYLDNGGDPNVIERGHSLLELAIYSFRWCENGEATGEGIRILVQNGADINLKLNDLGETAFHNAVLRCSQENIHFLLENGADINSAKDSYRFAEIGPNAYSTNMVFIKQWEESVPIKEPDCL